MEQLSERPLEKLSPDELEALWAEAKRALTQTIPNSEELR
jgi:hypothetical protein